MSKSYTHVIIGAKHPTIGYLYLDCIQDSTVDYADIYEVTDSEYLCEARSASWREANEVNRYVKRKWEEEVISDYLNRIGWYGNKDIEKLCRRHGIEIQELREWCLNSANWRDIPVIARKSDCGSWFEALSLIAA